MIIEEDTNDEETKRFNKIQYERKKALEDLRKEQNSKINKEMVKFIIKKIFRFIFEHQKNNNFIGSIKERENKLFNTTNGYFSTFY